MPAKIGDREMRAMADRIQARALDRCGELYKQIPVAKPGPKLELPGRLQLSPREQPRIEAASLKRR
jgi:hypothetical protein